MRQLASSLATPVFIVDVAGTLLFYNEPAERLLGRRYEETGEMLVNEWATIFHPLDEMGAPLAPESLPLVIALNIRQPAHKRFFIRGLDGVPRDIEVAAFPLIGQAGDLLGAVALFWEPVPETAPPHKP